MKTLSISRAAFVLIVTLMFQASVHAANPSGFERFIMAQGASLVAQSETALKVKIY